MLLACLLAWFADGGYASAVLLWIGFGCFAIGMERADAK